MNAFHGLRAHKARRLLSIIVVVAVVIVADTVIVTSSPPSSSSVLFTQCFNFWPVDCALTQLLILSFSLCTMNKPTVIIVVAVAVVDVVAVDAIQIRGNNDCSMCCAKIPPIYFLCTCHKWDFKLVSPSRVFSLRCYAVRCYGTRFV